MKKLIVIVILGCCISYKLNAQSADQLIQINRVANTTDMNNISSPHEGSLVYVESLNNLFLYDGSQWNTVWTNQGNSATDTCFIGSRNNRDFRIRTNNSQRMVVKNDGKVGVNLNNPEGIFQVNTNSSNNFIEIAHQGSASDNTSSNPENAIDNDINGTGWTNTFSSAFWSWDWLMIDLTNINLTVPIVRYSLRARQQNPWHHFNITIWELQGSLDGTNWVNLHTISGAGSWDWQQVTYNIDNDITYNQYRLMVHRGSANNGGWNPAYSITDFSLFFRDTTDLSDDFIVAENGNVGIGINPTQKLHVDGNILATGTIITPDYVFESYYEGQSERNPNYEFSPLEKIEDFVKEHKHLPGVPSAQEVEEQGGIIVNRATEINLEKIEELYLYIFELNKQNKELSKQLGILERKYLDLKSKLRK